MLTPADLLTQDLTSYVNRLQTYLANLPTSLLNIRHSYCCSSKHLFWTYVFLKENSGQGRLTESYTGPYHVLAKIHKLFTIGNHRKKRDNVNRQSDAWLLWSTHSRAKILLHYIPFQTAITAPSPPPPKSQLAAPASIHITTTHISRRGCWPK